MLLGINNAYTRHNKHKGHCTGSSICGSIASHHGFGKYGRSDRNDLCVRNPLYNHTERGFKVRNKTKRVDIGLFDVFHNELHGKVSDGRSSIHFPLLDGFRVNPFAKSSRFLERDMKYLVIGPGAMGFYAILGSVYSLYVNDKLKNLEAISGSSAGSIVAFGILVARWDIMKLMNMIKKIDIGALMKFNLRTLLNNYGLVSIDGWKRTFSELCKEMTGKDDFTFKELKEWSGYDLYISAYNLNLQTTCYFSHYSNPNMSVIDAVCMSMCIPFLFESKLYDGYRYIDMASFETSPMVPFLDKKSEEIITIEIDGQPTDRSHTIKNLSEFIQHFVTSIIRNRVVYEKRTIYIDLKEGEAFRFNMDENTKLELFKYGFSKGNEYLSTMS